MEKNSDIKIFVANSDSYCSLLKELDYDVKDSLSKANYLLIKDNDKEFDVNMYRSEMKYALENDIVIVFSSKGIPCFVDQFTDGTYFTKLFLDDFKGDSSHWKVYPPGMYSHAPEYVYIFPKGKEPEYYISDNSTEFVNKNCSDRCCYYRFRGLFY